MQMDGLLMLVILLLGLAAGWDWKIFAGLALVYVADWIMEKKCPALRKKLELPSLIFVSVVTALYSAMMVYSLWQAFLIQAKPADKVYSVLMIGVAIAACVWFNVCLWNNWRNSRHKEK